MVGTKYTLTAAQIEMIRGMHVPKKDVAEPAAKLAAKSFEDSVVSDQSLNDDDWVNQFEQAGG